MQVNPPCDCGKPATARDGSGYYCADCGRKNLIANEIVVEAILSERRPPEDEIQERKTEQLRAWRSRHPERVKASRDRQAEKLKQFRRDNPADARFSGERFGSIQR